MQNARVNAADLASAVLDRLQRALKGGTAAAGVLARLAASSAQVAAAAERAGAAPSLPAGATGLGRVPQPNATEARTADSASAPAGGVFDDRTVNEELIPRLNRAVQRGLLHTERK